MLQEKSPSRPDKPERAEAGEVEVGRSPVRCPWCHADCGPDEPRVAVCQRCLSRHHSSCWREGGDRCASCAGTRALSPSPAEVRIAPADLALVERGLIRQAIEQVAARNKVGEPEAMEALLGATSRKLVEASRGLPPWAIVAIVAISLVFAIPLLSVILG